MDDINKILNEKINKSEAETNKKHARKNKESGVIESNKIDEEKNTEQEKLKIIKEPELHIETIFDKLPEVITVDGKSVTREQLMNDPNGELIAGNYLMKQQAAKESKILEEKAKNSDIPLNDGLVAAVLNNNDESNKSSVEELLDKIGDEQAKKEVGVNDDDDIEAMLDKLEKEKLYSDIEHTEEKTGPADYTVIKNNDYITALDETLDENNINIVRKSNTEKNAILDRYSNSGDNINMALVNSGIFVNMSGAGPGEIIAMNQIKGKSPALVELSKLNHICEHITGSTVGRIKINRLIKIVSYYDMDSLYYGMYAGTNPDDNELMRTCDHCKNEYYIKTYTSDLLLNPDDFEKRANYIRSDITTYQDLLKVSELSKIHKKTHSSGITVYYRHPSIENYINTLNRLKPEIINTYGDLVEFAYGIDKITIPDGSGHSAAYSDPNEIIVILSKLKTADERYEILDMIDMVRPSAVPIYGFKKSKCPYCGYENPEQAIEMSQLLFFQASQNEQMAALRWTGRKQKRDKKKKRG